jgi:hypothetical protein
VIDHGRADTGRMEWITAADFRFFPLRFLSSVQFPAAAEAVARSHLRSASALSERRQQMRVDRKAAVEREMLVGVDEAKLVQVKGGLKAERVQGVDPSGPGGN